MTELLKISLPDGSVREMEPGATPADVAAAIGPGLAKVAIAARVDGELRDINRMTLLDSLKTIPLALWDETQSRMISFREFRRSRMAAA